MNSKQRLLAKAAILTAGLSMLTLPGCVVVPIPDHQIPQREFNRDVDEQSRLLLTPSKTTRKEVLLKLGQPDLVRDNERTFVYIADMTEEGLSWRLALIVAAPGGVWAGASDPSQAKQHEKYRLTINFDELGKVSDSAFEQFERQK